MDSNQRPPDYLSGALPTELTDKYSLQTGLEPAYLLALTSNFLLLTLNIQGPYWNFNLRMEKGLNLQLPV